MGESGFGVNKLRAKLCQRGIGGPLCLGKLLLVSGRQSGGAFFRSSQLRGPLLDPREKRLDLASSRLSVTPFRLRPAYRLRHLTSRLGVFVCGLSEAPIERLVLAR